MSNVINNQSKGDAKLYINRIADALLKGRASIMVGSGFSKNASKEFPDWQELGKQFFECLYKRLPNENDHFINPVRLAGELESVFGRPELDSIICEIPDTIEPSTAHTKLLELPWVDVFTTNYDTLLERAAKKIYKIKYNTVISSKDLLRVSRPRIIKLHGSLSSSRPFVVTEEDYRQYPKKNAIFVNTVKQSLIENVFCLIGFSGDDPNFQSWIGWVRDMLNKSSKSKIYLLNVENELSEPRHQLLSDRNIITINLQQLFMGDYDNANDNNVESSLIRFFDSIKKIVDENSLTGYVHWSQKVTSTFAIRGKDSEQKIRNIVEEWQNIRNDYPGWVVMPNEQRSKLWFYTQQNVLQFDELEKTIPQLLIYDYVYELVWRLNQCLIPLSLFKLESQCRKMVYNEEWKEYAFFKWFEIALSLLREYRIGGKTNLWEELTSAIEEQKKRLSEEQLASFFYEQSLQALFKFDLPLLRNKLEVWQKMKSLPLWDAKRASLWAELGEIKMAKELLEKALETTRLRINSMKLYKCLPLFSQEGYILSILWRVNTANCIQEDDYDLQLAHYEYEERFAFLRQYYCDPNMEQSAFKSILDRKPTPPREISLIANSFDIGKSRTNYSFSVPFWDRDRDAILGFSFLKYTEQSGSPFRLTDTVFEKESVIGAAERIKHYFLFWAFVMLARCGYSNPNEDNGLFCRDDLSKLGVSDIDSYTLFCVDAIRNSANELIKLENPTVHKNICTTFAGNMPEFLSRLCTKCSFEKLQKIVDLIVELYSLPLTVKQAFQGIDKLVIRLIKSYPKDKASQLFDSIKKIDWKPADDLSVNDEFVNPNVEFFRHFSYVIIPSSEEIENTLKGLESCKSIGERINKIGYCLAIMHSFNEEQNKKFANLLWDAQFIDKNTKFPDTKNTYLCSSFVFMPYPKEIDAVRLFKEKLFSYQENKDIFSQIQGGGDFIYEEWKNGYGILNKNRLKLNMQETEWLLAYVREYVRKHKQPSNKETNDLTIDWFNSFSKRQIKLVESIVLLVVIPNIVESYNEYTTDIRQKLDVLLEEMKTANWDTSSVKIVSLAVFTDRIEQTKQYIRQMFIRFSKQEINGIIHGIGILALIKNENPHIQIYTDTFVPYITEHIKNWLSPSLPYALSFFEELLSEIPEIVDVELVKEILPVLEILIDETNMSNSKSNIKEKNLLLVRQKAMRLASTLSKYFEGKNEQQPSEILLWKGVSKSEDEFWEIRNQWNV
jgi:hypothetical protein